jgi:hypothetical protein
MGGKFPVDIPPISNYIPGISDQFPLSSFAVLLTILHSAFSPVSLKGTKVCRNVVIQFLTKKLSQ